MRTTRTPALRRRLVSLLACVALPTLACASSSFQSGAKQTAGHVVRDLNPFSSFEVEIEETMQHGPYLLTHLVGPDLDLELLFPATDACRALIGGGGSFRYAREGVFGSLREEGGESCDAVGVASLDAWRDRRSRRLRGPAFPRDTARFETLAEDADYVLLRGRFRLAGLASIPGGRDLVALVPAEDVCRRPIERGEAALEFRDSSPVAYRLVSENGACPVIGFAQPPKERT
ncbi:MAG: hypothetical protein QNK05_12115 [Myxococcota bacterium]|nr:hypothetical protein [Myxococcota bacterium]